MSEVTTSPFTSVEQFVSQFPAERHGWIYVIHAVGTNRYKIGRSTEPKTRLRQLSQKQSPYPLELIEKFWSIDTITDEQGLHRSLAGFRVHGEWFEFEDDGGWNWMTHNPIPSKAFLCQFNRPITKQRTRAFVSQWLSKLLGVSTIPDDHDYSSILDAIEYGLDRVECPPQLLFWARLLDYRLPKQVDYCRGVSEREIAIALDGFLCGAWDGMAYFSSLCGLGGEND